jgi:hypothetical protein
MTLKLATQKLHAVSQPTAFSKTQGFQKAGFQNGTSFNLSNPRTQKQTAGWRPPFLGGLRSALPYMHPWLCAVPCRAVLCYTSAAPAEQ